MPLKTLLGNLSLRCDVLKLTGCQRENKDPSVGTLKVFKESEIIFNEEEARKILIQFFPSDRNKIMMASITTELRSFAQALLLEADALTVKFRSIFVVMLSGTANNKPLILPRYEQLISKQVWV